MKADGMHPLEPRASVMEGKVAVLSSVRGSQVWSGAARSV
jgi:hypothetical protein